VEANAERLNAIESGEQIVVGVNAYTETESSPLASGEEAFLTIAEDVERDAVAKIQAWRAERNDEAVKAALAGLQRAAKEGANIMEPSIACAKAGVTTGEWGQVLRHAFGEYRAPTGVGTAARNATDPAVDAIRAEVEKVSAKLGRRLKFVVGKPGLDGHSNGAEQIAVRARDCGMDVAYEGIRMTPEQIVDAAVEEKAHVVGLSILSGSHRLLVREVIEQMQAKGLADVPLIVGGIIPKEDEAALLAEGVAAVYTPKDFEINTIMADIVRLVE
jgi:(2R)-ethylmalonyl-CoA mutase